MFQLNQRDREPELLLFQYLHIRLSLLDILAAKIHSLVCLNAPMMKYSNLIIHALVAHWMWAHGIPNHGLKPHEFATISPIMRFQSELFEQ